MIKDEEKECKEQPRCLSLLVRVYECVLYMCEGEIQLTCTQARVSPRRMSRDSDNTAGGTLQIPNKETSWQKWKLPKLPVCSLSVSHLQSSITSPLKRVTALTSAHEISELCCCRKRCTVDHHQLPSAESVHQCRTLFLHPVHLMTNILPFIGCVRVIRFAF